MLMCIVDLAMMIFGIVLLIIVLTNGSFPLGNRELRGGPAYVVAALLMLPLPITFLIGCGIGINAARQGKNDIDPEDPQYAIIEVVVGVVFALAAGIVAAVGAKPKRRKKKKKRRIDDDYDDYDRRADDYDRPRRRDEEVDEEDERPRSRRRDDRDDEEERPRRRRFDEDGSGSHRPRHRRLDEDED